LIVVVVTSMSMGLGCSLAVNVDGLSANQQDGSPREAGTVDVGVGPEAPSSPGPMDAHEPDTDGARDSQMADDEEHDGANPVDRGASDTTPAAADAGTTREEMDAGAPDTSRENQDADAASAMNDPSDAATTDTATGDLSTDLSTAGDVEPGPSGDAASDRGDEAGSHPPACEPSPLVSVTLELANAPSAQTACGYVPGEVPRFFAAVDSTVFNGSAACGACVIIETPAGMVEARIVDLGPEPTPENPTAFAVSRAAIDVLDPGGSTFVTRGVDWHFAPCTLSTPGMTFKLQKGSSASYAAVLIENHRYRLAKVEYKVRGTYYPLTRSTYNYWIASQGMGTGPFTLRMTDGLGQTVEQAGIPLTPENVFRGEAQFPSCSP
jgi:hypothetical protein